MGFDRLGWEPVLGKLRRRFRLVLVDNRGTGCSDRPAGSFGVADMADDVIAVLDAAGIRMAHVMGVSLGGMVAQEVAITHPERVDGLVLACTTPGWPFAYRMPAASVQLIAATAGLTSGYGAASPHGKCAVDADKIVRAVIMIVVAMRSALDRSRAGRSEDTEAKKRCWQFHLR